MRSERTPFVSGPTLSESTRVGMGLVADVGSTFLIGAFAALAAIGLAACGSNPSQPSVHCTPGTAVACMCPDNRPSTSMCLGDGTQFAACACAIQTGAGTSALPAAGSTGGSFAAPTAGTFAPLAGTLAIAGTRGGAAGVLAQAGTLSAGGRAGAAGRSGSGGRSGAGGAASAGTGATTAGSGGTGMSNDQIEIARQVCVDEINMYRATLMVAPLMRGSAAQEMCSDTGAKKDGDSGVAHGSSRDCMSLRLPGQQDTCPGWPVGGRGGSATIADALKKCLAQMWAEGMPPVSREACIADSTGCFQKYGHYLNMSDPRPKVVACGFYQMTNGAWWMNQNFGS